jgi:hypothetical protein
MIKYIRNLNVCFMLALPILLCLVALSLSQKALADNNTCPSSSQSGTCNTGVVLFL